MGTGFQDYFSHKLIFFKKCKILTLTNINQYKTGTQAQEQAQDFKAKDTILKSFFIKKNENAYIGVAKIMYRKMYLN